jgi:serine/threonine protein kinase
MYTLLSGSPPFRGRTQQEIFKNILKSKPTYKCISITNSEKIWPKISDDARDLLRNLL